MLCSGLEVNDQFFFFFSVSADLENIDDGLESLCLSVTEHALSGEFFCFCQREEKNLLVLWCGRCSSIRLSLLECGREKCV